MTYYLTMHCILDKYMILAECGHHSAYNKEMKLLLGQFMMNDSIKV